MALSDTATVVGITQTTVSGQLTAVASADSANVRFALSNGQTIDQVVPIADLSSYMFGAAFTMTLTPNTAPAAAPASS